MINKCRIHYFLNRIQFVHISLLVVNHLVYTVMLHSWCSYVKPIDRYLKIHYFLIYYSFPTLLHPTCWFKTDRMKGPNGVSVFPLLILCDRANILFGHEHLHVATQFLVNIVPGFPMHDWSSGSAGISSEGTYVLYV